MSGNPFEPNITFAIEELDNPFEPIEFGEGGLNSGKKLSAYKFKSAITPEERKRILNTNAQRVYRNRNRDEYNDNMKALWQENKKEDNDNFKTWKANQAIANQNYRLNRLIAEPTESAITKQLRNLYKQIKPAKGRPKAGTPSKAERKELFFKSEANREKARNLAIEEYKKKKEKFLAENKITPLGNPRKLSDGTPYKGFGEKKTRPKEAYAKSDYKLLPISKTQENLNKNAKDLETYYNSVITTKPVASNAELETTYPKKGDLALKQMKKKHYANLSAGDWNLNGDYKRNDGEKGKRTEDVYKYPSKNDTF
jgi:hypothetical protein